MAGENTVPSPIIEHFSHPHVLELSSFQYGLTNPSILCSCCKLAPSGLIYICSPCNFILHLYCSQFPIFITRDAHHNHKLTLRPFSPYHTGMFRCNACGSPGNGFTYHCSGCRYDLPPICAFMPLKFTHQFHACPLALTFKHPFTPIDSCFCNICRNSIGSNEWRYRCSRCNFDVHLYCTTAAPAPATALVVQGGHHQSFPGGNIHNPVARPNALIHSASTGQLGNVPPSGFFNSVIQGLFQGAVPQAMQSLIQAVIGGGGGGGDDESSILGSLFGDPSDTQY